MTAAVGLAAGPEAVYWLASRACATPAPGVPCAVIVLGTNTPERQRRRVAAGVDAFRRAQCSTFVVSGGDPHSSKPEADAMALIAFELGLTSKQVVAERASRNTWENIGNSLPLVAGAKQIYVVSDALHAQRGRRYLCRRAPERCSDARPYGYYTPGDPLGKLRGAWHELGAYILYR